MLSAALQSSLSCLIFHLGLNANRIILPIGVTDEQLNVVVNSAQEFVSIASDSFSELRCDLLKLLVDKKLDANTLTSLADLQQALQLQHATLAGIQFFTIILIILTQIINFYNFNTKLLLRCYLHHHHRRTGAQGGSMGPHTNQVHEPNSLCPRRLTPEMPGCGT